MFRLEEVEVEHGEEEDDGGYDEVDDLEDAVVFGGGLFFDDQELKEIESVYASEGGR